MNKLMLTVCLALIPGLLISISYFGTGILLNVLYASVFCILAELICLKVRGCPLIAATDGSALLTGILLALALPPLLPVWMILIGCGFAIVFGKHIYGGLGNNLFNPAMIGFAVLIVSFPLAMSYWPTAELSLLPTATHTWLDVVCAKFTGQQILFDGMTAATPLDDFKFRGALTTEEYWQADNRSNWQAWLQINLAFLFGGALLLYFKVINWMAPLAMLATLGVLSLLFFDGGSSNSLGSPLFQLFSGATMLGAWFIVTDPVTSPDSNRGQMIFGIGVGALTFTIRGWGAYPEGLAFAVLLMNGAAPLIDYIEFRLKPALTR